MARVGRTVFFVAFVAVVFGAVWTEYQVQRSRADETGIAAQATRVTLDAVLATENAARDYTVTRADTASTAYDDARRRLDVTRAELRRSISDDASLRDRLHTLDGAIGAWSADVTAAVDGFRTGQMSGSAGALAAARDPLLSDVHRAGDDFGRAIDEHSRHERDQAGLRGMALVAGLCVAFAALNWLLFVRTERRASRDRERQLVFSERLQTARSEEAARAMLARHLEQIAPNAMVLVNGPSDPSPAARAVTSGGERVAAVIIRTEHDLRPPTERLVHDSLLRVGPVLATLRVLAAAQTQAATDPLTGLGNRRLVEDALGRLVAQARRTAERFAIAVLDLDRFKPVNDTYGHAAGDALLQAVARVLEDTTREYDVVGRHGGDEFIVLLAGIDANDAAAVMDRCRLAVAELRLGTPPIGVTASIGLAPSGPSLLGNVSSLVRAADDAVYVAKARGGNCVVLGSPTEGDPAQASALRA
ncbi:MAG TPA: diguanylate cyclase [Acidimicrobiia bacterium]|jgi:diguanylate cyclase (GGDEF)-like protein